MKISVSIDDRVLGKKMMWAEKKENDTFICPKCKDGEIIITYKDGIPKSGLRCNNCKAKYRINLTY